MHLRYSPCSTHSNANTTMERASGAKCPPAKPPSVESAILMAVAKIIATTQGRTPPRNASTPAYFIRFCSTDAISRMITKDGSTTPSVAHTAPQKPPCEDPMKVAMLMANGPGVDSDTAMKLRNFGQPAVAQHRCTHQRDHAITAAKRQSTDHKKIPEKAQIDHSAFPPLCTLRTAYSRNPAPPLSRI